MHKIIRDRDMIERFKDTILIKISRIEALLRRNKKRNS